MMSGRKMCRCGEGFLFGLRITLFFFLWMTLIHNGVNGEADAAPGSGFADGTVCLDGSDPASSSMPKIPPGTQLPPEVQEQIKQFDTMCLSGKCNLDQKIGMFICAKSKKNSAPHSVQTASFLITVAVMFAN